MGYNIVRLFAALGFVVMLLFFNKSTAQFVKGTTSNGILPRITPPSPEASSLGKYGEWPVSQFTGTPSISLPLYTISTPNFELPISLNYHSGGVKVDEVGSWVGTNWSISAGGVINRTIVGQPDENYQGFLSRNLRNEILATSYDISTPAGFAFMMDVSNNVIDVEPDIFYFNFAGYTGKFYFDQTGKFQCIPVNSLKLLKSPVNNTNTVSADKHWEIADDKGNVYHFGSYLDGGNGLEDTKTSSTGNNLPYQTTAWYLTKIVVSNSDEVIFFDYDTKFESYSLPQSHSFKILTNGSIPYNSPSGTSWDEMLSLGRVLVNGTPQGEAFTETMFSVSGKSQLSKIRWKYGEIVFQASLNRSDIIGKMLTNIEVWDKDLKKIKNFDFQYSLTNNRYYLNEISEKGTIGAKKITHSFEYNLPDQLPARGSFNQDHWGYFNGASNTNLLPANAQFPALTYAANREPAISFAEKGSMQKITYPTGGTTEFRYESHRYDPNSVVGGNPGTEVVPTTKTVKAGNPQPGGFVRNVNFSVPFDQYTSRIVINIENYTKPVSKNQAWLPLIRIEKLVGGSYQQVNYWDAFDNFPSPGNFTLNGNGSVNFNIDESLGLSSGDYRLVADLICISGSCGSPSPMPLISATLNYQGSTGDLPIAGGLRIKELINKINGVEFARKKYQYAPGKIINYPIYVHEYAEDVYKRRSCPPGTHCLSSCTYYFAKYKELTSSPQGIIGMTNGSSVGYPQVFEFSITPSGSDNGYTEYKYNFVSDIINSLNLDGSYWSGVVIQNPLVPFNSSDHKRGLLVSKTIFKSVGSNQYRRVNELVNTYAFNDGDTVLRYNSIRGMRVKKMRFVQYDCGTSINGYVFPNNLYPTPDFGYGYYDLRTSWVQLASVEEKKYDVDGNLVNSSITVNTYSNPDYLQMSKSEVTTSKGDLQRTEFKYSYDYPGNSVYSAMMGKHIISPVIETKQSIVKGGVSTLLQTSINEYKVVGDYHKPDVVKLGLYNNSLENRARYISYDAAGNIQEMGKPDDKVQSIIWDNISGKPAAIFDNASISDVAYTSFENDTRGHWSYTGVPQFEIAPTGLKAYNVSNGAITKTGLNAGKTYIISYWTKNTSAFNITGTVSGYPIYRVAIDGYRYVEHKVTGVASVSISGTGFIDELRLYPDKSECVSYVYNPLVGIISTADKNSDPQRYIYDELGRLILIKDVHGNIIKQNCYSYFGEANPCTILSNQQQSLTFTKNCSSGYSGSTVNYSVPAGLFYASSQADANALAMAEVTAYGQAYANANGTCVPSSVTITCTNTVTTGSGSFEIRLTNEATSQVYTFFSSYGTNINLGTVPTGMYTIYINRSTGGHNYLYQVGCGYYGGGTNYTFNNVPINSICNTITISNY